MASSWERFNQYFLRYEDLGFTLDISRMRFDEAWLEAMEPRALLAFTAMQKLEAGAIANPDENRMVGHYWLRNPQLAPTDAVRRDIEETNARIKQFAAQIHAGEIAPAEGKRFQHLLLIGIGGSALGPQFVAEALRGSNDPLDIRFFDNTDPDGFDRVWSDLGDQIAQTLVVVVSKSGGTKETRNGMLEAEARFAARGLTFSKHAAAVTGIDSELDQYAVRRGWLARFPMFDWIGGRTSVMSAVGVLPATLQGFAIDELLRGAAAMDERTRASTVRGNAAMLLALTWFHAGNGRGEKDMVVLPYKDRLALFSRYLQQLVMESLGKEKDLAGNVVHQGIAVYGNKGSTDQHAYVQQLRDGIANFFVTFIEVEKDRETAPFEVEPGITSGDYLHSFLRGTRSALTGNERGSITLTLRDASAFSIGALIALYERAVGFYGSLVNVNAYHQPGVEAGKTAATELLELQKNAAMRLRDAPGHTADELASAIGADAEDVFHVLSHLAETRTDIRVVRGTSPAADKFYRQ